MFKNKIKIDMKGGFKGGNTELHNKSHGNIAK